MFTFDCALCRHVRDMANYSRPKWMTACLILIDWWFDNLLTNQYTWGLSLICLLLCLFITLSKQVDIKVGNEGVQKSTTTSFNSLVDAEYRIPLNHTYNLSAKVAETIEQLSSSRQILTAFGRYLLLALSYQFLSNSISYSHLFFPSLSTPLTLVNSLSYCAKDSSAKPP